MLDLSELLVGERFFVGKHSRLYRGVYKGAADVAVKIIHPPDGGDGDGPIAARLRHGFAQEVAALSCLSHPRIVKVMERNESLRSGVF
jgi:hypothetical protein